eukprot:CFRG2628T1
MGLLVLCLSIIVVLIVGGLQLFRMYLAKVKDAKLAHKKVKVIQARLAAMQRFINVPSVHNITSPERSFLKVDDIAAQSSHSPPNISVVRSEAGQDSDEEWNQETFTHHTPEKLLTTYHSTGKLTKLYSRSTTRQQTLRRPLSLSNPLNSTYKSCPDNLHVIPTKKAKLTAPNWLQREVSSPDLLHSYVSQSTFHDCDRQDGHKCTEVAT